MIELQGSYELKVRRAGRVVHSEAGRNLITTVGEEHAAGRFGNTVVPTAMDWIALGSADTSPAKTDTELDTEIANTRTASTSDTHTANSIIFLFEYTHGAASITVKEAGLFNNAAFESGDMAARFLTQVFTLANGDILDLTWTLTFEGVD
jgi:hypothetical protein